MRSQRKIFLGHDNRIVEPILPVGPEDFTVPLTDDRDVAVSEYRWWMARRRAEQERVQREREQRKKKRSENHHRADRGLPSFSIRRL